MMGPFRSILLVASLPVTAISAFRIDLYSDYEYLGENRTFVSFL